ncbi:PDPR isoform 4 [Pongo abelii]|uniref:PDPR isoform 4 n=1 Tax=Pongo abelii TaxID=9601 RepID=A0A2J8VW81_PONAB|nr:PDPR isoform 4 [Pongo abelii]
MTPDHFPSLFCKWLPQLSETNCNPMKAMTAESSPGSC